MLIWGNETPYYYVDSGNRLTFIRVGNESVVASSVQLNSLILRGMNKTFDTILTTISIERAAFSKLKSVYFQRTGNDLRDNDLLSFGLVSSDHYLTNAGALLADEPLVRQSRVFATRWNGLDKTNGREEALDDKEFEGSLLLLLQNSIDFVKTNSKKRWKKVDTYRVEYPDYPERAIQEEYDVSLRPEFRSTQSSFFAVLKNLNYEYDKRTAEKNGDKGAINPDSKGNSSDGGDIRPAIKDDENGDKGAINPDVKGNASDSGDIRPAVKTGDKTTIKKEQKRQILIFAEMNLFFKAKDIAELLGLQASRARYLLQELVKDGKIKGIGNNKGRKYQLIK